MVRYVALFAVLVMCEVGARADKLDDFKDAVSKTGCESIPYSDLQGNCKSQQSDVNDWCKGNRGPVTCDSGGTKDLQAKLDKEQKSLETLKDKRRDLDDKRSHAASDEEKDALGTEIENVDKDIETSKNTIDGLQHDLSRRKDLIDKTIYTINKCIDYRTAVMNVFSYALDKVRGENDPAIKPYADQLSDKYEESKRGHQLAIDQKNNALESCKKEQP